MNYALAKKLKDAGFPQNGVGFGYSIHPVTGDIIRHYTLTQPCEVKEPTLSELIEACGNSTFGLAFNDENHQWYSRKDNKMSLVHEAAGFHGHGSTPDEAVANLWLILNAPKPSLNS